MYLVAVRVRSVKWLGQEQSNGRRERVVGEGEDFGTLSTGKRVGRLAKEKRLSG